jgi:hypothetical protein
MEAIADKLGIPREIVSDSPRNRVADVVRAINDNPHLTPRAKRNLVETCYVWARDSKEKEAREAAGI